MAGGGIKINNIKVSGGADGKTPIFKIENGKLYNSYANGKDGSWVELGQVKGNDGVDGKDGATGAKLLSQELIGQDEQGGNIYKQTFSDGTEAYFTAPKGQDANPAEKGTSVTVGGVEQKTWNADSKVDKVTTQQILYGTNYHGEPAYWKFDSAATAFTMMYRSGDGTCSIADPIEPSNIANKKYVDTELEAATSSNTAKIENLTNILLDNEQMAIAEVSQAFTTRQTADGENIIDEQNVFPKLIKGSTVKTVNLLDDSYFINKPLGSGFTSKQIPFKIASGTYTAIIKTKNVAKIQPNVTTLKLHDNADICIIDILETGLISNSNSFNNAVTFTVTEEQAKVIEKIGFFFNSTAGTDYIGDEIAYIMLNEGTSIKPYSPYFNGLKHAYFKGVRSTDRNLIDFITPFAASSTLRKPFSFAEGTYTLQVICDDYDGQKTNVVAVEFLDENYNRVLPLNDGSNNGINSWSTFSITAEEAARTRYIHVYMNSETGADLIGKIIKLMLNHGTEALPYEPYTEDTSFAYTEAQELKEWDYLLPQEGKKVEQSGVVAFDGTENWSLETFLVTGQKGFQRGLPNCLNSSDNTKSDYFICDKYEAKPWGQFAQVVSTAMSVTVGQVRFNDDRFTTVDEWKAYLAEQYAAGNPVIVEYKLAEATEEDIVIPNNYTAYQGGLEKVVQGNTDNSEYGAMCTLTNDYFVKVGGATNEQTE